MKNKKIRVAVLFGGKSAEHEVSIQSAKNVIASLDNKKYEVIKIKIGKEGNWDFDTKNADVVFPVLHGPFGEDGTVQGLLRFANIRFVGSGVLGSAIGMDKDVAKRLMRDAGLPVAKFLVFRKGENVEYEHIEKILGVPFFLKPANLGSSVGVSKVKRKKDFLPALKEAFQYDTKIIIEEYIEGREIECSVLGNDDPIASVPGEIIAKHEFYDYDAKYIDENGADLKVPADLAADVVEQVQLLAIKVFKILCLEGMARVDFFLAPSGKIFINETNTIPGFTNISMYPKLWKASGISYQELVDRLIELAIEKHNEQQKLKTSK